MKDLESKIILLEVEIERLRKKEIKLTNEIGKAISNNNLRNRQLSALHYVFCDGGCFNGVHRYEDCGSELISPEVLEEAVKNTCRLIRWAENANNGPGNAYDRFTAPLKRLAKPVSALRHFAATIDLGRQTDWYRNEYENYGRGALMNTRPKGFFVRIRDRARTIIFNLFGYSK